MNEARRTRVTPAARAGFAAPPLAPGKRGGRPPRVREYVAGQRRGAIVSALSAEGIRAPYDALEYEKLAGMATKRK
jgi:hypothetical protein